MNEINSIINLAAKLDVTLFNKSKFGHTSTKSKAITSKPIFLIFSIILDK